MDIFLILLLLLGSNNNGGGLFGNNTTTDNTAAERVVMPATSKNTLESLVLILTFFLLREINSNSVTIPGRDCRRTRDTAATDPFFDTADPSFDTVNGL